MKIWIDKTMVEFGSLVKTFNGKSLVRSSGVDTKNTIVNKPSESPPPILATSSKLWNAISPTDETKNIIPIKG